MNFENNSEIEKLHGQFTYCIYKSFNYAVMQFEDKADGSIVATGALQNVELNKDYIIYGEYINHPKYGFQFKVIHAELDLQSSLDSVIAYLSSDLFKGIGKKKAAKVAEYFGPEAIKILKDNPERIKEVDLKSKDQMTIVNVLKSNLQFEDSFYFLIGLGIPTNELNKIINVYKENTIEVVKNNPYQLYYDIYGFGFSKCEEIAKRLKFKQDNPYRLSTLVAYLANDLSFRTGNTYFSYEELNHAFYQNHENQVLSFDEALMLSIENKTIIEKDGRYYARIQYLAEDNIANFLYQNDDVIDYDQTVLDKELRRLE